MNQVNSKPLHAYRVTGTSILEVFSDLNNYLLVEFPEEYEYVDTIKPTWKFILLRNIMRPIARVYEGKTGEYVLYENRTFCKCVKKYRR